MIQYYKICSQNVFNYTFQTFYHCYNIVLELFIYKVRNLEWLLITYITTTNNLIKLPSWQWC